MRETMREHAGHNVNIDVRGTSGAVALDCEDCEALLILWKAGR